MMHINGSKRKIPPRCCMTGTDEMFDSIGETEKEVEVEIKGREEGVGETNTTCLTLICHIISDKTEKNEVERESLLMNPSFI